MNNKGQVLVLFVLLLPIIIMVVGMVNDMGMMLLEINKLDNLNKYIANYSSKNTCDETCVKELIDKNDTNIQFSLTKEENLSIITLEKNIDSLFGKIINIKNYPIKSKYAYGIENSQIIVKKMSIKE